MKSPLGPLVAAAAMLAVASAQLSCATSRDGAPVQRGTETIGYSSFGISLYKELLKEKPGENIFISPASIGLALAMTYNGAAGETRDAMANVLRFTGKNFAFVNVVDSTLISNMNDTMPGVMLSIANSLWGRQGVTFKRDFLMRNERFYGAEIQTLDFGSPEAPTRMNEWVASRTHDRITKIIDKIDDASILFLINAIYFKGTWTKEFDRSKTQDGTFHFLDGTRKARPLMNQSGRYPYFKGDGFQAARLPYGDGRIGMYVFLPDSAAGLNGFHERLAADSWNTWMQSFAVREGRIALPRFKLEYEVRLRKPLSALGMGIAFDGSRADLTGMVDVTGANACIDDVMHKTFVEVNEEGTEAAAVTSVDVRLTTAMEPQRPFEMVCDHPFFVAIRDTKTGLILFMGAIVSP